MGLFNKLFRGAPRIGLSNEDRGAAKIADDVLSRSGHLSRTMEREGVLDPSMQKSRLFGSVALGGAVIGSGAAATSLAFDNQNTFGNTMGGTGAGAMIGLAASVAVGARRGRQGKLVGSKDAFAHAAVTGQNYKPITFADSVFGDSKILAKQAREGFENQEGYDNAARAFYDQSMAKGQQPTKFQRTMSSAWEHTKNAKDVTVNKAKSVYRHIPEQFNSAKNKTMSTYRYTSDKVKGASTRMNDFIRNRKQTGPTVSSSINEKNAQKYEGMTHSAAAAKMFGNDGPRPLALPNRKKNLNKMDYIKYDMHNPERTTYSQGRKIDWYDRMYPFGLHKGIKSKPYEGPIQTSTPQHLAKSSAGRKYQPTSPNFTKYSRYEDKPFITTGEAELGKPIGLKNKTQRYKSFTHTANTLEPAGPTTRAPNPRKHRYKKPSK